MCTRLPEYILNVQYSDEAEPDELTFYRKRQAKTKSAGTISPSKTQKASKVGA
jgi:hypothetical protein